MSDVIAYNARAAGKLEEVANILASQGADPFRVRAYRNAAETIRGLPRSLDEIVETEGSAGLDALPGVGQTLSRVIYQLVVTGKLPMRDRLRGTLEPTKILASVAGVGERTAELIHRELGIDTLEELEAAAYDGRLAKLRGIGQKRLAGIKDSLSARLGRLRRRTITGSKDEVPIEEILDVDREYREKCKAGDLPTIAPRRFNPRHERWLPVLHTTRGPRRYTALFSNTALAHELDRTRDWVVIYVETDHQERQFTVVTTQRGKFQGKRVVRGREAECCSYYLDGQRFRQEDVKTRLYEGRPPLS